MSSQELLHMITRNRSAFVTKNLKRTFTNDVYSGSLTLRKTDPGFVSLNSTGVCMKNGKMCFCRKTALKTRNGKSKRSALKLAKTC